MLMQTMTCLLLTAVASKWLVIGMTVIGTVFLPLWALEMGHNAAVDLAAAVRWKPCNCNFPRLPIFFLHLNADMIIYEFREFHDPRALETWSPASKQFQKYMVVNEKMSPLFIILQELSFFFQTHVFTRQQRFAAGSPLRGKVRFEVSILRGEDHTSTNTGIVAGR